MSATVFIIFLVPLLFSCLLCLVRIGQGPTPPDRTVAVDILGTVMVNFCALMTIFTGRDFYLVIAIAWALLSFIGTLALAKFLEGRSFDD